MRHTPLLVALALLAAACRGSITDPYRTVSGPVPSELSAAFRSLSAAENRPSDPTSITAAGDSVTVVATGVGDNCSDISVKAGFEAGVLVVTTLHTLPPEGRNCLRSAPGPTRFKVAVGPVRLVPRGRLAVTVRERSQTQAGGSEFQEREIARMAVTVR